MAAKWQGKQEKRMESEDGLELERIWEGIVGLQGTMLYTKSGLPFAYCVKDKSIFIDRKKKTITKSTIEKALWKLKNEREMITGPKALGMFGAPYIWALFAQLGIVGRENHGRTGNIEDEGPKTL